MLLIEYVGHICFRSLTDGHLGRHLEYFKTLNDAEWHQLDSSSSMPQQQESTKKKFKNQVPGHSGFLPDYCMY